MILGCKILGESDEWTAISILPDKVRLGKLAWDFMTPQAEMKGYDEPYVSTGIKVKENNK